MINTRKSGKLPYVSPKKRPHFVKTQEVERCHYCGEPASRIDEEGFSICDDCLESAKPERYYS